MSLETLVTVIGCLGALLAFFGKTQTDGPGPAYKNLTRLGKAQMACVLLVMLGTFANGYLKRRDEEVAALQRDATLEAAYFDIRDALHQLVGPFVDLHMAHFPDWTPDGALRIPTSEKLFSPEAIAYYETVDLMEPAGPNHPGRTWRDVFAKSWERGDRELDAALQKYESVLGARVKLRASALRHQPTFRFLSRLSSDPAFYTRKETDGGVATALPLDFFAYAALDRRKRGEERMPADGGGGASDFPSDTTLFLENVRQLNGLLWVGPTQ
jgi:hypothetical protein